MPASTWQGKLGHSLRHTQGHVKMLHGSIVFFSWTGDLSCACTLWLRSSASKDGPSQERSDTAFIHCRQVGLEGVRIYVPVLDVHLKYSGLHSECIFYWSSGPLLHLYKCSFTVDNFMRAVVGINPYFYVDNVTTDILGNNVWNMIWHNLLSSLFQNVTFIKRSSELINSIL